MGLGHLAIGLVSPRTAPQIPLWALLVATEVLDILWGLFALVGLDSIKPAPWSHSLFMAALWSVLAGMLAGYHYRSHRAGSLIGGLVASHWVLDFVSHPMFGGPPNLPLFLTGSPQVGLGLYTAIGMGFATVIELGMLAIGTAIYLHQRRKAGMHPVKPQNEVSIH
jgi:hypothetical protein